MFHMRSAWNDNVYWQICFCLTPATLCSVTLSEQYHSAWADHHSECHGNIQRNRFVLWLDLMSLCKSDFEIEFWPFSTLFTSLRDVSILLKTRSSEWRMSQYECGPCHVEERFLSLGLRSQVWSRRHLFNEEGHCDRGKLTWYKPGPGQYFVLLVCMYPLTGAETLKPTDTNNARALQRQIKSDTND